MLPEKQQLHKYVITEGHSKTLGATIEKDGVNFAVWCPAASIIELLLFKDIDDCEPDYYPCFTIISFYILLAC